LRRALRPKHLRQRIETLRRADLSALVAHILKRLPRGLTRRRPIRTAPEQGGAGALSAAFAPAPIANSS